MTKKNMQYKVEWWVRSHDPNIIFHNFYFTIFKINIIERYGKNSKGYPKLLEVLLKLRTLDDELILKKDGSGRVRFTKKNFLSEYKDLAKNFNYHRRYKGEQQQEAERKFVDFLLLTVVHNYNL